MMSKRKFICIRYVLIILPITMNITESSKATTAAPAVAKPIAESAKYVGGKSAVEDPSKEADKVCIFFFIKFMI